MKQNNKFICKLFATVATLSIAAATLPTFGSLNAQAESTANKTAVFDTSWWTRITAPIDYVPHYDANGPSRIGTPGNGACIEMDVISSELKSEANATYIKTHAPTPIYEPSIAINIYPISGVSFNFWRYSADLTNNAWGWNGPTAVAGASQAMNYLADGRILISGYLNETNATSRYVVEAVKYDANGELVWNTEYPSKLGLTDSSYIGGSQQRGDIEDVKTFLDPGYSYKLEMHFGYVDANLNIYDSATTNFQYNPWYVAYRKDLDATEWETIFAIPLGRNHYLGSAAEGNCYAGFELNANGLYTRHQGLVGNFNIGGTSNIKMELDNISIYNEGATTKNTLSFDDATDDFILDESNSEYVSGGTYYNGAAGASFANHVGNGNGNEYYKQMKYTQNNITINSINAPQEAIQSVAKRSLNERPFYTVSYVDRDSGETIVTRQVMKGLSAVEPTYFETGTLYVWEAKAENVTGDMVIYGREYTEPFAVSFDPNGGSGSLAPIYAKFGTKIQLPDASDAFTREHYVFAGWAIKNSNGSLKAIDEYTVVDHNETLYALWKVATYSVKYYNGDELLSQTQVLAFEDGYYDGAEPLKEGSKFIGWSMLIYIGVVQNMRV